MPLVNSFSCLGRFSYTIFLSVLDKAGLHMQDTLIAAYITLIVGYLIIENKVRINVQSILFK